MPATLLEDTSCIWEGFLAGITPPPPLNIAEWAEENLYLPRESSAEVGRFRLSRTPYLRKPLEAMSPDSTYETVVVMKGAQLGFTTAALAVIGYHIDLDPAPILFVQPDIGAVKKFSKKKLEPIIRDSPALRAKVAPAKSRDSGNTTLMKEYPGGSVTLVGAKSSQGLSGDTVRIAIADEVARYGGDVQGQGDSIEMIDARTSTYANSKKLLNSTPEEEETCIITREFEPTDQNKYFVPCPHCGHMQTLEWGRISWKKDVDPVNKNKTLRHYPEDAHYICEKCQARIDEHNKPFMLENGEWRPTKPENSNPAVIGFHLSQLYAPLGWKKASWAAIARSFIKAAHAAEKGDSEPLKAFFNLRLGEPSRRTSESLNKLKDLLYANREPYNAQVPMGACLLTCAVDVQADRLEADIAAWGPGEEFWAIEKVRLFGRPEYPEVWDQLDALRMRTWMHESGVPLSLAIMGVDTGYKGTLVGNWIAPRQIGDKVIALKGASDTDQKRPIIMGRPKETKDTTHRARIWLVGGPMAKDHIFAQLGYSVDPEAQPGPGFMHFPRGYRRGAEFMELNCYDGDHFAQLTAERQVKERNKKTGKLQYVWYLPSGKRNEALDLTVYNVALLRALYTIYPALDLAGMHRILLDQADRQKKGIQEPTPQTGRRVRSAGVQI